jgi:high-affinity Fe2+/Pb2+ permease
MKKRKVKVKSQKIGTLLFIVALLLFAFATAFTSSDYYGVAIGILIGFLVYFLFNKLKN